MITFRQKEFIAPIIAALAPAVIQGGAGIIQGKKANESQEKIARQQQVQAIKDRKAQEQQANQAAQLQNNQLKAAQKQQNQLIKLAKKNPEAAAAVKPTITVGQPQEQSKTFSKVGAVLGGATNLGIGALNSGAVTTAMSMKMNKDQLKSNEKIAAQENANRALETKAKVQENNNSTAIKMQELKNQKNEFNKSYKLARKGFSAVKEGAGFVKNLGTLAKERNLHGALAGALVAGTVSGVGSYLVDKAIQKDIKKSGVLKVEAQKETAEEKKARKKKRNRKIAASVLAGAALGGGTIAAKKGKFGKDAQDIASKITKENIKSKVKGGGRTIVGATKDYFAPYDQKKGKRRPNYLGLAIGGASLASPAIMYAQKKKAINEQIKASSTSLSEYGITLNTYEDIPTAVAKLEESKVEVNTGIETINTALDEISAGKDTTSTAMQALDKAEIEQSIQLAETSATLNQGLAQLEAAEEQIDTTAETTKSSADLNKVLSLDTLNNLLIAQNFDMPAGYASGKDGQVLVKVGDNVSDVEALKKTVLIDLDMDKVGVITLEDVADIEKVDDSETVYAKLNGQPGILLAFEKQTGYSTGDVTDRILARFDSLESSEKEDIHFSVLMNQGVYIDMIVDSIMKNILLGAALAILVLILFLRDFRPTIIIACAIPLSVIFAVVLMYFSNITMNIISMSGLTLGIGMLVDNSIVVIENIFRLRKEGEPIKKACVYGASQVAGAITSSTLTTMCVFLPIVFTEGLTRSLFVDMGLTIAFTLTASLLVALTLVPAMAQGLLRHSKVQEAKEPGVFMRIYEKFLRGAIRFKPLVFLVMILLMVASVFLAFSRGTEFMPEMVGNQLNITMSAPDKEERTFEEMTGYADEFVERIQWYVKQRPGKCFYIRFV